MKIRKHALSLAAIALTATSASAAVISINNAGFETSTTPIGNGNNTNIDGWTEDTGDAFVDANGTQWVPEASDTVYIYSGTVSINQDLSHNWQATDSFTVGLIAMNPTWAPGTAELRVQLRQASDDAVLWDSGVVDVTGTVAAGPAYTGTGHILSWNFDASAFVTGSPNEQINIRIASETGTVYADNVSLSVDTIPEPSAAALLGLGGLALLRRRRR